MFTLKRICSNKSGTFDALIQDNHLFMMVLEPQFPKLPIGGPYKCELFQSPKLMLRGLPDAECWVYKIDFPQEDGRPLEFHIGNDILDTEGCLLTGGFDATFRHNGLPGVFNSKIHFDLLMATKLPYFWLTVE